MNPDCPSKLTLLSNGARFVETDVPGDTVYAELYVNVGWDEEDSRTNGICHFLEHMNAAFTSRKYPSAAANRRKLDDAGASTNAYTSAKTCGYHISVHRDGAAELLDMFLCSISDFALDRSILTEEASAIRRELISGYVDSSWYDFETEWNRRCYPGHIRGVEIKEQVKNVDALLANPELLLQWRRRFYVPQSLTLSLAGDKRAPGWSGLRDACIAHIAMIDPGTQLLHSRSFADPFPEGRHDMFVKNVTSSKVRILYPLPVTSRHHAARCCAEVVRRVLVNGLSSRLYKLRYENGGMIYGIRASVQLDRDEPRMSGLVIETSCDHANVDKVCARVRHEMSYPPSADELDKVRHAFRVEFAEDDYTRSPSKMGDRYGHRAHVHGLLFSTQQLRDEHMRAAQEDSGTLGELVRFWAKCEPFILCGHAEAHRQSKKK